MTKVDRAMRPAPAAFATRVGRVGARAALLLIGLLALGGGLRLSALSLMEFRHDSAYWSLDAYRILAGGYLPLTGQQVGSVQVPLSNGPLLSYLTALVFALVGVDPVFVALLIALCSGVGIALTYLLGQRLYSRTVGLVAAALAAVSPWLVLYGRMLWPQALFPFLIPLGLLVLAHAAERERARWYVIYGVVLGVGLQLHLSAMALLGASIVWLALYARRRLLAVAGMLAGALMGYSPLIAYDVSHGFPNLRALMQLPALHAGETDRLTHMVKTVWNFANVLSGQGLWVSKLGREQYLPLAVDWAQGLVGAALFVGALALIVRGAAAAGGWRAARLSRQDGMLVIFVVVPVAYLLLSRSVIQRHYFLFLYPAPLLVIARGVDLWMASSPGVGRLSRVRLAAPALVGVLCALNLVTLAYAYSFLAQRGGEGEYGTVLTDKQRAVQFIQADSHGAFSVDVRAVQETLPYVFLFQARGGITVEGREDAARSVAAGAAGAPVSRYRIVEPAYHAAQLGPGERELYRSRGVVVIGVRADR